MSTPWRGMGTALGQRDCRTCSGVRQGFAVGISEPTLHLCLALNTSGVPNPRWHLWVLHPRFVLQEAASPKPVR